MNRDPSIHIKLSDLKLVLKQVRIQYDIKQNYIDALANALLERGKHLSCSNRSILENTNRVSNLLKSTRDDAGKFSLMLTRLRKSVGKHRGVKPILPGTSDWPKVKEITGLANDFNEEFGLNKQEGYKIFITLLIQKTRGSFILNRLPSLVDTVKEAYRSKTLIERDLNPTLSSDLFKCYYKEVNSRTGVIEDSKGKESPSYKYFVEAALNLKKYPGITAEQYIAAQFEGLEWANTIPTPPQLVGENAIARLNKYMVKNNLRVKTPTRKVDWASIKDK